MADSKGRLGPSSGASWLFAPEQRLTGAMAFFRLEAQITVIDIPSPIRFNKGWMAHVSREKPMKKLVLAILLIASPAWAQTTPTQLTPKKTNARVDNCAPIGRTADGKLIYSLKCDNLPAPPPPPPEAEVEPPPEPVIQRGGIFGMSFAPPGAAPPASPAGH